MEDLFDSRWFKRTKFFVSTVGQWPYQTRRMRNFIRITYHFFVWSVVPGMLRAFYLYWIKGKLKAVVLCFPTLFTIFGITVKYNHYTINNLQTKELFERVRSDWILIKDMDERSRIVLEKFADIGRTTVKFYSSIAKKITYRAVLYVDSIVVTVLLYVFYSTTTHSELCQSYIYLSLSFFVFAPHIPRVLDVIYPLNESRHTRQLFPIDYGEVGNTYVVPIILQSSLAAVLVITIIVACESIYMPLVFHCCGLFAVVSFHTQLYFTILWGEYSYVIGTVLISDRLERASTSGVLENIRKTEIVLASNDENMICLRRHCVDGAVLASCVKLHNRAIWYADHLNAYYSINFLLLVTMNMILISVTGLQIVLRIGVLEEIVAAVVYLLAQLLHLFFLSLPGQFLMNTSESVRESAYNFPWYNLQRNVQKLLILIIMRSSKPSFITAGSFFILNMETFSSVVQTSMSYLTVLSSFY